VVGCGCNACRHHSKGARGQSGTNGEMPMYMCWSRLPTLCRADLGAWWGCNPPRWGRRAQHGFGQALCARTGREAAHLPHRCVSVRKGQAGAMGTPPPRWGWGLHAGKRSILWQVASCACTLLNLMGCREGSSACRRPPCRGISSRLSCMLFNTG
jgi:hypothetical protein